MVAITSHANNWVCLQTNHCCYWWCKNTSLSVRRMIFPEMWWADVAPVPYSSWRQHLPKITTSISMHCAFFPLICLLDVWITTAMRKNCGPSAGLMNNEFVPCDDDVVCSETCFSWSKVRKGFCTWITREIIESLIQVQLIRGGGEGGVTSSTEFNENWMLSC